MGNSSVGVECKLEETTGCGLDMPAGTPGCNLNLQGWYVGGTHRGMPADAVDASCKTGDGPANRRSRHQCKSAAYKICIIEYVKKDASSYGHHDNCNLSELCTTALSVMVGNIFNTVVAAERRTVLYNSASKAAQFSMICLSA